MFVHRSSPFQDFNQPLFDGNGPDIALFLKIYFGFDTLYPTKYETFGGCIIYTCREPMHIYKVALGGGGGG